MAQSRRDQLQAYRFLTRRAQAALVTGEPNAIEPPMRRLTVITISGIMVAILVTAGFALYGVLRPSGTPAKWHTDGNVVIEKQTGSRYVVIHGLLYPVLNFTSAELAAGNPAGAHVVTVSRSSLAHTQRGATIGIPGLPDSLPPAGGLRGAPLTACSRLVQAGVDRIRARVSIDLDDHVPATAVPNTDGIVVRTPGGSEFLLWQGHRLAASDPALAAQLRLDSVAPVVVGSAFVDAIPPGSQLAPPQIPGFGRTSTVQLGGQTLRVGQVLRVTDDGSYRVVLADGIAVVTPVEAVLLSRLATGSGPASVRLADVANLPQSEGWSQEPIASQVRYLPTQVPNLTQSAVQAGGVCAVYASGSDQTPQLAIPAGTSQSGYGNVTESAASQRGVADVVTIAPGSAAVVRSARAATVYLVAAPGERYAFVSAAAQSMLGYGAVVPEIVPDWLLSTLPLGPALDPDAARKPVSP